MQDLMGRLNVLFQDVFDDDDIKIVQETTAADVDNWDSLMHVTLMLAVEKRFGIRFTSSEVASLQTVGELVDLLQTKGADHR